MSYLANKNFFRKVFIFKFFFFLINLCLSKSYADIVKSFDLMPFENNSSIFELNVSNYSNNFFPNTLGNTTINSLKLNKSSTVKVGFLSSGYNKYGFDLQFSNTEFKTKYTHENINPLSINFRLIRPNSFSLFPNWDSVFKASFGIIPDYEIQCYEGNGFNIGGKSDVCNIPGRNFYPSLQNGIEKPAVLVSSKSTGLGFGLRRQSVDWDKKIIFEGMFESIINNYNARLGSGFNTLIIEDFNKIPSDKVNLNNFIKLSAIQAKRISEKWAFGAGVTSYILLNSDNKNLYSKTKKNLIFDTKLTRKTSSNFYFSAGGRITTNYNFGLEPMLINERSKDLYDSFYGEISLNMGFFSYGHNKKPSKTNFNIPYELFREKHNIKIDKNEITNKDNDYFQKESLKDYAINFAKNFDKVKTY